MQNILFMKRVLCFRIVLLIILHLIPTLILGQRIVSESNIVDVSETRKAAELLVKTYFSEYEAELFDMQHFYDIDGKRAVDVYVYTYNNWSGQKSSLNKIIAFYRHQLELYADSIKNIDTYKNYDGLVGDPQSFREKTDLFIRNSTGFDYFISVYVSASGNKMPILEFRKGLPEQYVLDYDINTLFLEKNNSYPRQIDYYYFGPGSIYASHDDNTTLINVMNRSVEINKSDIEEYKYNHVLLEEEKMQRAETIWLNIYELSLDDIKKMSFDKSIPSSHTIPNVPNFRQQDWTNVLPAGNSCAVMAAASALFFYDDQGYWNLVPFAWKTGNYNSSTAGFSTFPGINYTANIPGWGDRNIRFGPENALHLLAEDLDYDFRNGGTPVNCWSWESGSHTMPEAYTRYTNTYLGLNFSYNQSCGEPHNYSTIKSEISANRPMNLRVTHYSLNSSGGPYNNEGGHRVAIVAYNDTHWVGGDPIGVFINGTESYDIVWWNYANIRSSNPGYKAMTCKITPGGSHGTWVDAPSTASPSNNQNVCTGSVRISWQNMGPNLNYRLQISPLSNFSTYITYGDVLTGGHTYYDIELSNPGTYYYRVAPTNSDGHWCHFSNTFSFNVINPPSRPDTISGPSPVCSGTTNSYSVSAVSDTTEYEWQLPSGWSGSSTSRSINVTAGSSGGEIRVRAKNACGDSPWRPKSIMVSALETPTLAVEPTSLSFGNVQENTSSVSQSYALTGSNLTENVTVNAPNQYQVSLNLNSGYGSSVTVSPSGGSVNRTIYVRFNPTTTGQVTGNVSNSSSGATSGNVSVSGTGITALVGCIAQSSIGQGINAPNDGVELLIVAGIWAGEFSVVNSVVSGEKYRFRSTNTSDYITITNSSNEILHTGQSPVSWTATFSGTVRVHVHTNSNCGVQQFVDRDLYVQYLNCVACSITKVYSLGDISTDYGQPWVGPSSCPGILSVTIPNGYAISGVDVSYTMTTANYGWLPEQRSRIYSPTTGTGEEDYSEGSGSTGGTYSYERTGLTFANGASGTVVFHMDAGRTWGNMSPNRGCNTHYNKVDNNTWELIVHYRYKELDQEEVIVTVPEIPQRTREDMFFKVYPNPTDGTFTLELETIDQYEDIVVEVLNMLGKRLVSDHLPLQKVNSLSLEGHQPGMYIIRVTQGEKVGVERLIKR